MVRKFHAHAAFVLMFVKEIVELGHHGREIRVALNWRVGTAAQAAAQSIEIEDLIVGNFTREEFLVFKERADVFRCG